MSSQVHKALGYGLVDVETDGGVITDRRFDPKGFLRVDSGDRKKWTQGEYLFFLREHYNQDEAYDLFDALKILSEDVPVWNLLEDVIIHRNRGGLANIVCIVPPVRARKFFRSGDDIDFVEEHFGISRFSEIEGGFFPWNHVYMDDRNGRYVEDGQGLLLGWKQSKLMDALDPTQDEEDYNRRFKEDMNRTAVRSGFDHYEHAAKHLRSFVPHEIRLLCEYCDLFSDSSVVLQLKPLLYVYWS